MGLSVDEERSQTEAREKKSRKPFGYPGSKSRHLHNLLPHLPYSDIWVDVCGGSGAVTYGRERSQLEVFNDICSGVTSFYRCIHDITLLDRLLERLEFLLHSREEFQYCRDTWKQVDDVVERAARWWYSIQASFVTKGQQFGRAKKGPNAIANKLQNKVPAFMDFHDRFRTVMIENQDAKDLFLDFDSPKTVFYYDPPFIESDHGCYDNWMTIEQHERILDIIFTLEGFVAVSGYSSELYSKYPWTQIESWEARTSMAGGAKTESNHLKDVFTTWEPAVEYLFIKDFS